jgi:hypothetical protein
LKGCKSFLLSKTKNTIISYFNGVKPLLIYT